MTDLAERRGVETEVYEPAADSRLLAEAAAADLDAPERVLDVGTGTGYVAARVREATGARVVGTDLNPHACRRARENGVEAVRCDLLAAVSGPFDAVTCNPPYLPDIPGDAGGTDGAREDWLSVALSGGESGRAVVERFLDDVGRVLAEGGAGFLLVSTLTGVDEVAAYAGERGFHAVALADANFPGETLTALKLVR